MLSVLQTSLIGLANAERGLAAAAQNIANVNTAGYRARGPDGRLRHPHTAPPSDLPNDTPAPSDVDLTEEVIELKRHAFGYRAAARLATVGHRRLGELLDVFG